MLNKPESYIQLYRSVHPDPAATVRIPLLVGELGSISLMLHVIEALSDTSCDMLSSNLNWLHSACHMHVVSDAFLLQMLMGRCLSSRSSLSST